MSKNFALLFLIYDALRDLIPFEQIKNREKRPWRSVTYSKVAGFTKSNTLPWVFFTFFKLYKWYQIAQSMTYDNMSSLRDIISSRNCSNVTVCSCRIFRCTEGLVKLPSLIPPYSIFLLPTH